MYVSSYVSYKQFIIFVSFKDFDDFQIRSDLGVTKSDCLSISQALDKQMYAIAQLNQDIEESKKKLLEIQFNVTIASLMFNVY